MNRKQTINLINILTLVFGILFMFLPNAKELLLGVGFIVTSLMNLIFNNLEK